MAALKDSVKRFIVQALACYDTPTQVVDAVKEEFDLVLPRQHVSFYDPTKAAGKQLAKKWRVLFDDTRERFRREVSEIPIADQAFRLRAINKLYLKVERQGNTAMAAQLLEQAAKEAGDAFTNKQRVSVNALVTSREPKELTDEELAEELAKYGVKS